MVCIEQAKDILHIPSHLSIDLDCLQKYYRSQAFRCHPDKAGSDQSFIEVKEAYDFLRTQLDDRDTKGNNTDLRSSFNQQVAKTQTYHDCDAQSIRCDREWPSRLRHSSQIYFKAADTPEHDLKVTEHCDMDIDSELETCTIHRSNLEDNRSNHFMNQTATEFLYDDKNIEHQKPKGSFPAIHKFGQIRSIVFAMIASGYSQITGLSSCDILAFFKRHLLLVQHNKGAKIEQMNSILFVTEKASDAVIRARIEKRLRCFPSHIMKCSFTDNYTLSEELLIKGRAEFSTLSLAQRL